MNNILQFIARNPRNRLIIVKDKGIEIPYIDVGKQLSKKIQHQLNGSLANHAAKYLDEIMEVNMLQSKELGGHVGIENVGVLMEKELKFDFKTILKKYSRGTILFVKWEGDIDSDNLYFLTKEKGVVVNLKGVTHIKI